MKKVNSIFDVLGPIMIGPSSSHTAGAARLAKIASSIAGENIVKVKFYLHGSFMHTYKGHGTDRALLAGIMGLDPYDEQLRDSFELAQKINLKYEFIPQDLGPVHPNTVKFEIENESGAKTVIMGSSTGGGAVLITNINGYEVKFTSDYFTLIINYPDVKGVITSVSSILSQEGINIATMNVSRKSKGKEATMIIETDGDVNDDIINKIKELEIVTTVIKIGTIKGGEINV
ncbi:MAG: L-serine ammonia-lyase, iron-sulfur-dependent subunit beta [Tissierellia bacterium]|nr:L-serine ammonia-lyase, iron-sulfur-dependent subunit beta [Tissierellia bacterium]